MEEKCPKCGANLGEITETSNGRKVQRCSNGSWNKETKTVDGCNYVKWITPEPEVLDEKCPKCGAPLVMAVTRYGKKMKKCSTNTWNKDLKKAEGCDFIEWINNPVEKLEEDCPKCGEKLVLFTTSSGKKMKKCSTAGWDREKKEATGCTYIEWLNSKQYAPASSNEPGSEDIPPEPDF